MPSLCHLCIHTQYHHGVILNSLVCVMHQFNDDSMFFRVPGYLQRSTLLYLEITALEILFSFRTVRNKLFDPIDVKNIIFYITTFLIIVETEYMAVSLKLCICHQTLLQVQEEKHFSKILCHPSMSLLIFYNVYLNKSTLKTEKSATTQHYTFTCSIVALLFLYSLMHCLLCAQINA